MDGKHVLGSETDLWLIPQFVSSPAKSARGVGLFAVAFGGSILSMESTCSNAGRVDRRGVVARSAS